MDKGSGSGIFPDPDPGDQKRPDPQHWLKHTAHWVKSKTDKIRSLLAGKFSVNPVKVGEDGAGLLELELPEHKPKPNLQVDSRYRDDRQKERDRSRSLFNNLEHPYLLYGQ